MNLIQYSPSSWFDTAFNRLLSDFFPTRTGEAERDAEPALSPRVEVRDEKDRWVVSAELPGVDKKDVTVQVQKGVLTLGGEKKRETESNANGIYRSERVYGAFRRSFGLPENVDEEKIQAEYRNGVLRVELFKKPQTAPKQIAIRTDETAKEIGVN